MTGCYDDLVMAGVRTRDAAALMGLSKATQDRRRSRRQVGQPADPAARPVPVNKLSDAESAELIAVLNSQRFVDKAPPQIYATLLVEGTYLCSISTMYRTLERNRQVRDRRRPCSRRCKQCAAPGSAREAVLCRDCRRRAAAEAAKEPCPRCGKPGLLQAC